MNLKKYDFLLASHIVKLHDFFFPLEYHFGDAGAHFRYYENNGYGMEGYKSKIFIKTIVIIGAYT
jgi:hypothetical protein